MLFNKKGFTLIELMVVIVIIGILAALAIPKFTSASDKAKWSEAPTVLASYENAQLARIAETGSVGTLAELIFDSTTVSKWFTYNGATKGTYKATVTSGVLGGVNAGEGIQTTVSDASVITHSTITANQAVVAKMIPNFF